jgi:hypothetical protein
MRSGTAIGVAIFAGLIPAWAAWADSGQIIAKSNLGDICKSAPVTYRKTIVYVDLRSIRKDEREWGLTILNKLELGPRESLTILGVNPSTFEVSDFFDSCYPTLTKSELDQERAGRGVWDKLTQLDPESQQRENLQTFETRLRSSLDRLIDASAKTSQGKRHNVLGAIAVDKNRFTDPHALYRIIIYSNGAITDPSIGESGSDEQIMKQLAEKYNASFSGGEVYVYGVIGEESQKSLEARAKIFSSFFLNSWGVLRSFAPSLPHQTNGVFQQVQSFVGTFEGGGTRGNAKLTFTSGPSAETGAAWLTFVVGINSLFLPFQTEYSCDTSNCRLTGVALENVPSWAASPYFRKGDRLTLGGKPHDAMEGALEPATREIFQSGNREGFKDSVKDKEVQYTLKFRPQ